MTNTLENELARILTAGHREDKIKSDITSQACLRPDQQGSACILLKENARIAGLPFLTQAFAGLSVTLLATEGQDYPSGTKLARLTGPLIQILAYERTALNLLQHCSGIATATARYVHAAQGKCDILDTRKTLPGFRHIQKYAVRMGGGKNHRFDLAERILIKSTHISLLQGKPLSTLIRDAKAQFPTIPIEVEVESLDQIPDILATPPDFIMLDNMDIPTMAQAVALIQNRAYIEASGGMTLDRIPAVAATGVHGISVGALTHSVKAIDISLKIF